MSPKNQTHQGHDLFHHLLGLSRAEAADKWKEVLVVLIGNGTVDVNANLVGDIHQDPLERGQQLLFGDLHSMRNESKVNNVIFEHTRCWSSSEKVIAVMSAPRAAYSFRGL